MDCLHGSDVHSIPTQLFEMTTNLATYQLIRQSLRNARKAPGGGVERNELVFRFVSKCFWATHLAAVRRLTDPSYPLSPKDNSKRDDSVYSLISILRDMKDHAHLFTRENMLRAEGLEYDPSLAQRREAEFEADQFGNQRDGEVQNRSPSVYIPRELDSCLSRNRHESIDLLAGVQGSRAPKDAVQEKIFDALSKRVQEKCNTIRQYATKLYAHAASPTSRATTNIDAIEIGLEQVFAAHEAVCKSVQFVSEHLLGEGPFSGFLPRPIGEPFVYLDKPLFETEELDQLPDLWQEMERQFAASDSWSVEELLGSSGASPKPP